MNHQHYPRKGSTVNATALSGGIQPKRSLRIWSNLTCHLLPYHQQSGNLLVHFRSENCSAGDCGHQKEQQHGTMYQRDLTKDTVGCYSTVRWPQSPAVLFSLFPSDRLCPGARSPRTASQKVASFEAARWKQVEHWIEALSALLQLSTTRTSWDTPERPSAPLHVTSIWPCIL